MKPTPTKRSAKVVRAQIDPHGYTDSKGVTIPVFVLPAAPEDVERMREIALAAVSKEFDSPKGPPGLKDYSDAVLRALGLTSK